MSVMDQMTEVMGRARLLPFAGAMCSHPAVYCLERHFDFVYQFDDAGCVLQGQILSTHFSAKGGLSLEASSFQVDSNTVVLRLVWDDDEGAWYAELELGDDRNDRRMCRGEFTLH